MNTHQMILKNNRSGFTLVEMMVVIALIVLVGTFATGQIISQYNKSKVNATKVQIKSLATLLDQYRLDCGSYPTSEQGLEALLRKPEGGRECKNYNPDGYMKGGKPPEDGFGYAFQYESDGNTFEIKSLGNDNAEGGEALDADISSKDAG